jgi:hypothetical protein
MDKKLVLVIALIAACLSPCAQGTTIVWVAESNLTAAGVGYDQGWIDLLTAQGYTVDVQRGSWMTLDATKLATLEAADLVIVSRTSNSGNYATDSTEVTQWNSVTTPLILMTAYLARNNRWLWINSSSLTELLDESSMTVVKADHPVFAGVPITNGQVDVIDGTVDSGQNSFITSADCGNGTLIAKRTTDNSVWIAEWAPGTPFYSGSTETPAGKRLYLVGGGGGAQTAGSMNFTAEGRKIFLNAVLYMLGRPANVSLAGGPVPADGESDVLRDSELSWTSGEGAATHDVYFGTVAADVNEASRDTLNGVLVAKEQAANTFDPGRLQFGGTYYWRIDEVEQNGTVHKGDLWSFTVEPYSYPIAADRITPSASSSMANMGPEKTIDGSGLNASDQHSTTAEQMWLSTGTGPQPAWIRYDFDRPYMLDKLLVWNSNQTLETAVGWGARDVTVEYSADGIAWTTLGQFVFAQAPGLDTYVADTIVDFGNVVAKCVRLTIADNWGGVLVQCGLSEVRFLAVPTVARAPVPAGGATSVTPQVTLTWRSGREAASHQLYLSTDQQAVIDGTVAPITTSQPSYAATVDLVKTYYWKVVEVNDAESPAGWPSDVWSFTTADYAVVDDFEAYTNDSPNRVFQAWIDGGGFSPDPFFPNGNPGNGTGSFVGYDPLVRNIMETTVFHGGAKSVPFLYDNDASVPTSETTRTFDAPQDWTASTVKSLMVCFYGDPDNTTNVPLWVKLGEGPKSSAKVTFGAVAGEVVTSLAEPAWTEWNIPLSGFAGVNLAKITSITIGMGPGTGSGQLFLDDVRLYPARVISTPPAGVLVGHWKLDNNAQDSSGNGNHGTLVGGPTYDAAGRIGAALSLDGVDDGVDCGNGATLNITDTITLSVWVKTSDAGNAQHNEFVAKGDQSYGLKHNSGNYLEFVIYDGGAWYAANGPTVTTGFNGTWHHVAGTYDGTQCKLYLDGKLIASRMHTGAIATTTYNVGIGRNTQYTDRLLYGLIDDVRVYHGVLSSAEIAKLANP